MTWVAIVASGFVATVFSSAFFWIGYSLRLTEFSPSVLLGCWITGNPRKPITETVGFLVLLVAGTTLVPILYRALLETWSGPAWIGGLTFGGFLGVITAAALPLYGRTSACVKSRMLPAPGPFGIEWGRATPGIIFAGQMIYGSVVAAMLAGF